MTQWYIANAGPEKEYGREGTVYLATMINPVDKRVYDIIRHSKTDHVLVVAPLPNELYEDPEAVIEVYGTGSYDDYDDLELYYQGSHDTYYRSHTPSGVVKKSSGLGLLLYSGLTLSVVEEHRGGGVFSREESRSESATRWWKAQVERDYAEEEVAGRSGYGTVTVDIDESDLGDLEYMAVQGYFGEELEGAENIQVSEIEPSYCEVGVHVDGSIDVQFLPVEKVVEAKIIVAWNTDDLNLDSALSDVELPPKEILAELDLTTVGDANLILNLWDVLVEQEASDAQKRKFLEHVPPSFSQVPEIMELQGQQTLPFDEVLEDARQEVAANPRSRAKHSKAWKNYFGDLADEAMEMNAPVKKTAKRKKKATSSTKPKRGSKIGQSKFYTDVVSTVTREVGIPSSIETGTSGGRAVVLIRYNPEDLGIAADNPNHLIIAEFLRLVRKELPQYSVAGQVVEESYGKEVKIQIADELPSYPILDVAEVARGAFAAEPRRVVKEGKKTLLEYQATDFAIEGKGRATTPELSQEVLRILQNVLRKKLVGYQVSGELSNGTIRILAEEPRYARAEG